MLPDFFAKVKAQLRAFQGRDEDEKDSKAETEVVGTQGTSESNEPDVSEVMAEPDLGCIPIPQQNIPSLYHPS